MSLWRLALNYFRQRIILPMAALGIALGIGVLFTVFAVFHGFLVEMEDSIREMSGDLVLEVHRGTQSTIEDYRDWLAVHPEIESVEPQLHWFGLVGRRGSRAVDDPRSADLSGIVLSGEDRDDLPQVEPGEPVPMLVGAALAEELGLAEGDVAELVTHRSSHVGRASSAPVRHSFRMVGSFRTGRFDQDLDRVIVRRSDLQRVANTQPGFSHLLLRMREGTDIDAFAGRLQEDLWNRKLAPSHELPTLRTWRDLGGNFLRAAEDQKGILSVVFGFIVLVAAYQLISTLLLTVAEKRRDIGILGAVGASPARIAAFFVGLGLGIAVIGIGLGLLLGWWLIHHLEDVESWLGGGEAIFRQEIYKFDHIPAAVDPGMVVTMVLVTLATAALFSLLPAFRASRQHIVRSLRRR